MTKSEAGSIINDNILVQYSTIYHDVLMTAHRVEETDIKRALTDINIVVYKLPA